MRGRTSEIRGRTTPLVVLLSVLLFMGNENAVLVKKIKMEEQSHVFSSQKSKCHLEQKSELEGICSQGDCLTC